MENMPREAERRAFLFWMCTGRRLAALGAAPVGRKFNPWHDPGAGRFTFGRGSGPWDRYGAPAAPSRDLPAQPPVPPNAGCGDRLRGAAVAAQTHRRSAQPHRIVERNGYRYEVDPAHRTREASGNLSPGPVSPRSRSAQARAGGTDRRAGDDGGHYIARRFNGPSDAFNHFAQSARFNRGSYRALEDTWARTLRQGKRVFVRIRPHYAGNSQRPLWIEVHWETDGFPQQRNFPNQE